MASTNTSQALQTFTEAFSHFIGIDFACKQIDEERPHEIVEALLDGVRSLCKSIVTGLEDDEDEVSLQLWPTILTTCEADALISREAHQDRGTLLVGLQKDRDFEAVDEALRLWQADLRSSTLFIDYIPPPSLSTMRVRQEDLGRLVVDSWTMPELLENPITVFTPTSIYQDSIQLVEPTSVANTTRAGNSVAAATARRSPSPNKKLTPASAILNRLKWDDAFDSRDYVVVYEDRHAGLMESPVESWTTESTEETFIPMHRVRAVKKKSTGMVMWHREERIDLISRS